MNRQGPDIGDQYRSAIFVYSDDQRRVAQSSRETAQSRFDRPIATKIEKADTFWPAEEYHQDYLKKRGRTSCSISGE